MYVDILVILGQAVLEMYDCLTLRRTTMTTTPKYSHLILAKHHLVALSLKILIVFQLNRPILVT